MRYAHAGLLSLLCVFAPAESTRCADYTLVTPAEKTKLAELVKTNTSARIEFEKLKNQADAALKRASAPVQKLQLDGSGGDAGRKESLSALRDMPGLYALAYTNLVTGESKYADKAREYILAWAKTHQPNGNPYNETHLEPLILAYDLTRSTFNEEDRKTTDAYLRKLIAANAAGLPYSNSWQSHRIKIVGLAAFVLNDAGLLERAIVAFKNQLVNSLNVDGSAVDYHEHDALRYQINTIEPLLAFAVAAHKHGMDLYEFSPPGGASLRKAVRFLLPYCSGEKEHEEFVHSKKPGDLQTVAYGEAAFTAGTNFRPAQAFKTLTLAAYFDEAALSPVISKIIDKPEGTLASWVMVQNAARPSLPKPAAPKK